MEDNSVPSNSKKINFLQIIVPLLIIIFCISYFIIINNSSFTEENSSGEIKICCVDQNNHPASSFKIILKNSNGENLKEVDADINGNAKLYGIEKGNYVLEVVKAPEGYDISGSSKNIEIKPGEETEVKVECKWTKGNVLITIINDANDVLPGCVVELYDKDGYKIETATTNEDGKCSFNSSENGTYYFKQISTDPNVIIDETLYRFVITDEYKTFCQTIVNDRKKGNLLMVVKNEDETVAQGIKYDVFDSNKELIITITTNSKGLAGVKNMPLGKYYYQEKEQKYDKEMHEFEIKENEEIVRVDITLEKNE